MSLGPNTRNSSKPPVVNAEWRSAAAEPSYCEVANVIPMVRGIIIMCDTVIISYYNTSLDDIKNILYSYVTHAIYTAEETNPRMDGDE